MLIIATSPPMFRRLKDHWRLVCLRKRLKKKWVLSSAISIFIPLSEKQKKVVTRGIWKNISIPKNMINQFWWCNRLVKGIWCRYSKLRFKANIHGLYLTVKWNSSLLRTNFTCYTHHVCYSKTMKIIILKS